MTSSYLVAQNCKVVKGSTKSLLLDLQRQKFYRIDNSWVAEKSGTAILNIDKVKKEAPEVFNFLRQEEIIIRGTVNPIPISDKWESDNKISNAVFEVNGFNYFSVDLIDEVENLGIEYIALVVKDLSVAIGEIMPLFHQRNFANVDIVTRFDASFGREFLEDLVVKSRMISSILVYNSPENDLIDL